MLSFEWSLRYEECWNVELGGLGKKYNVVKWLSLPCAILPAVSNQDNAMAVWTQLHDGG